MSKKLSIESVHSENLKKLLNDADIKNHNGEIDKKKEWNKLSELLSNNADIKAEIANESDEVKQLLGYTASASQTTASKTENAPAAKAQTPLEEVTAAYFAKRGYDATTGKTNGTTSKEAYEAVKDEYKNKGEEYKKALKQLKKSAKHTFAHLTSNKAMRDALGTDADGEIVDKSKLGYNSSKAVRKHAKEYLIQNNNGKLDKWEYTALKDNDKSMFANVMSWLSGRDSEAKKLRKDIAADNSGAAFRSEHVTLESMKSAIGKRCPFLQESSNYNGKNVTVLEASGLLKRREDGTFDVTELSRLVRENIGNATLDKHSNRSTDEIQKVRSALGKAFAEAGITKDAFDASKITNRDIRQLVDFLKYYDPYNFMKYIYGAAIGAGFGALSGAATAKNKEINVHINQDVYFQLDLGTEEIANDIMQQLKEQLGEVVSAGGTAEVIQNGSEIIAMINQLIDKHKLVPFIKNMLPAAMKGAIVGAGLGLIGASAHKESEKAVFDITNLLTCDKDGRPIQTYEQVIGIVDAQKYMTEEDKFILKALLFEGVQTTEKRDANGNIMKDANGAPILVAKTVNYKNPRTGEVDCRVAWSMNCCDVYNKIIKHAGNQEFNHVELVRAANGNGGLTDPTVEKICNEEDVKKPSFRTATCSTDAVDTPYEANTPVLDHNEDWGVFATRYNCLIKYVPEFGKTYTDENGRKVPAAYARTMMKVLQAINNDKYDLDRIVRLTDLARNKKFDELKEEKGFDFDLYYSLYTNKTKDGKAISIHQKLPTITLSDETTCNPDKPTYSKKYDTKGGVRVNAAKDTGNKHTDGSFSGNFYNEEGNIIDSTDNKDEFDKKVEEWKKTHDYEGNKDCSTK